MDDPQNAAIKQCAHCKEWKPATKIYFSACRRAKDGLASWCKVCDSNYHNSYRKKHADKFRQARQARSQRTRDEREQRFILNPDSRKQCIKCLEWLPATPAYFHRDATKQDGLKSACKACSGYRETFGLARAPKVILPPGKRQCTECKQVYPETAQYFFPENRRGGYRSKCKQCQSAQDKAYYVANKEQHSAFMKQYYNVHLEEYQKRARVERVRNPGGQKIRQKRYAERNREKLREHTRSRRAKLKNASGSHTAEDIRAQYERQNGLCYWCNKTLDKYHVDHLIPLSRGGSNDPPNLVVACPTCNMSRNNKLPHEWRRFG